MPVPEDRTATDDVQRLTAERDALAQQVRHFTAAQRLSHVGSYDFDIAANTNDWSDELYRIYGREPGSFAPTYERFLDLVHPDDRQTVLDVHQRALADVSAYQMEERITWPDGQVRTLASWGEVVAGADGRPARMVGICWDITEQKRAEGLGRMVHDAEVRRRHAVEINDNVVQGLASVLYLLDLGRHAAAHEAAGQTLASARQMMSDLLDGAADGVPASGLSGGLVRSTPHTGTLDAVPAPRQEAPAGALRVLLADDAEDIRFLLRLSLTVEAGFDVVAEAADGGAAVELARAHLPDVVVLDLSMPVMDGLDALPEILRVAPACRVVVLSGFDEDRMRRQALERGACAYLEKGRAMTELVELLAGLFPDRELGELTAPR